MSGNLGPQFDDLESLQKNSLHGQVDRMRRDGKMDPEDHAQIKRSIKRAKSCTRCTYLALDKRDLAQHMERSHR